MMSIEKSPTAARLSAFEAFERGRPHLLLLQRVEPPPAMDLQAFDTCAIFDSENKHGPERYGALWDDLLREGYAVWNPGPLNAQLVAISILRAQHRQMFLSRKILAAAKIGTALPIREAPWEAHSVHRGWSDETLRHPLDARYGKERVNNWERTARNNVSDFVNIYTAEFNSERILTSAVRAYDSLTASYGHAAAPQTEFLPTPLHMHSSFSSVVLNAFHGNHSPTWCVAELQVLSPALSVIAAIGRLARNGQIAVTQSLVRDAVALCHPDFGNDAATAIAINFELREFVKLIIGSAQLLELTRLEPPTIPEFVSSEPTAHSRCCQTCSDPASDFAKILLFFELSENVSVIVKRCDSV